MGTFFGIVIAVAVYGLASWWIVTGLRDQRPWRDRLGTATARTFAAVLAATFVGGLLVGSNREAATVLYLTLPPALLVVALLFIGAWAARIAGRVQARKEMRLSGHPVEPNLWPAWAVATATGVIGFFVWMPVTITATFLVAYPPYSGNPSPRNDSLYQETMQNFTIGGAVTLIVVVFAFWAFQKASLWSAWSQYEQLKQGIEYRLEEQRLEFVRKEKKRRERQLQELRHLGVFEDPTGDAS